MDFDNKFDMWCNNETNGDFFGGGGECITRSI